MNHMYLLSLMLLVACTTTPAKQLFEISTDSVTPGSQITWRGQAAPLSPSTADGVLRVGDQFPKFAMVGGDMKEADPVTLGTVTIVSTLPSLDTPVCDAQTHALGESRTLNAGVKIITVSMDLPYAQSRFAEEARLTNIAYFSDYRTHQFGERTGLQVKRNLLLARALIVVDRTGIIRHLQVVPEITKMPDIEKAIAVANQLFSH